MRRGIKFFKYPINDATSTADLIGLFFTIWNSIKYTNQKNLTDLQLFRMLYSGTKEFQRLQPVYIVGCFHTKQKQK